ncbi:MAG: RNA 2',3'-cyclic phosphodiesterase [Chitinophagales bacterium]|nr:RNA 2',3'-cyclic phosphodiesterase [Chitinophagales bacterium]
MKRLFFAIPLPKEIKKQINYSFPPKSFHGIRWIGEEDMHITVHFLGATGEEELPQVLKKAEGVCESVFSFELKFASYKTIVKDRKPIMVWAQFEENNTFEDICLKFRESFPTEEKRKPAPHLTLARIKQLHKLPFDLPKEFPFSFIAHEIDLMVSQLHADGAKYELVKSWYLN